jgi:hypothetical protein
MSAEEWRLIPGFPNYAVSTTGRVVSYQRPEPHELKPCVQHGGYLKFGLTRDGKLFSRTGHSLVALAFLGPRPVGLEVRHLDGDPINNTLANLKYGTHEENMRDRLRHGRDPNAVKTACARGHAFDETNTYVCARGKRTCKTCRRATGRAWKDRQAFRAAGIRAA